MSREGYIGSQELAHVSLLAKRDGSGAIGRQASEVHAGWEMTTNHLPNVREISNEPLWQEASQRPEVFCSLCWLVKPMKCLINLKSLSLRGRRPFCPSEFEEQHLQFKEKRQGEKQQQQQHLPNGPHFSLTVWKTCHCFIKINVYLAPCRCQLC